MDEPTAIEQLIVRLREAVAQPPAPEFGKGLRLSPEQVRKTEYAVAGLDPEHMELCRHVWIALHSPEAAGDAGRRAKLAAMLGQTEDRVDAMAREWEAWSGYGAPGSDRQGDPSAVSGRRVNDLKVERRPRERRGHRSVVQERPVFLHRPADDHGRDTAGVRDAVRRQLEHVAGKKGLDLGPIYGE